MTKRIFTVLVFTLCGYFAFSQSVTNIKAWVTSDNKIAVEYHITGAKFYQNFNVSLFVSLDDGATWQGPLTEVAGDIGKNIEKGKHVIYWDFLNEIPIVNENVIFDVRAEIIESKVRKSFFIAYSGNDVTPFGVRIGLLGKTGFYLEARMSPIAFDKANYTFEDGNLADYDQVGYYEFTKANGWAALSVLAGATFQIGKDAFLYTGAGYAFEKYLYTIDEYTYNPPEKIGEAFVEDKGYSITGVEIDAGLMLRFGKFLITGGGYAINFESFGWTAGVGVSF